MRAYNNIRLTGCADVADVRREGRKSSVGRIPRGETACPRYENGIVEHADGTPGRDLNASKIIHNDRGYCSPRSKASARRYLKRVNRRLNDKYEALAEELVCVLCHTAIEDPSPGEKENKVHYTCKYWKESEDGSTAPGWGA